MSGANAPSDAGHQPSGSGTSVELGRKNVYNHNDELFQDHYIQQYKLYVEMADRVSARRHLTNVFFLTLQTTVISFMGLSMFSEKIPAVDLSKWLISTIVLFAMICFCYAWYYIIQSYRKLNTAKYQVVGKMEDSLPSSPYWKEEWKALGEGKDPEKYLPLTYIESWMPKIFGGMYFLIWVYLLLMNYDKILN